MSRNLVMMNTENKVKAKKVIVNIISLLFVVLFVYAAVSKILDFENFKLEIGKSPLLNNYTNLIVWSIPLIEIFIAILLLVSKMRMIALHLSLSLMTSFTAYIFLVLNYTNYIPCSCGGILENLGWTEHLIFNLSFIGMVITAIILNTTNLNYFKIRKILLRNE